MNRKKRNCCISVFLITISLLSFTQNTFASSPYYHMNNIRNDLIWNCRLCDTNKMNALFGENWSSVGLFENLSQGKKMKWNIHSTGSQKNSSSEPWVIFVNVDIWMWNNEEAWGTYDYNRDFRFFNNASHYPSNYNLSNHVPFVPFMFPVPTGQYVGTLKLSNMYDIDNRVLPTLNIEIDEFFLQPEHRSERITIIALYDGDGILNSFKLYTKGYVVIIDIVLESVPLYVLPATLGLVGAFFIAIIVYVRKQRKKR